MGLHSSGFAQQRPQYTQYVLNNFLLNPALSGIENYTDIKAGFRRQWMGIDDAPQTSFVSANWKLGDDYLWRNALSLPEKDDNPMNDNYMQNYTSSPAHHGMGVIGVLDKVGPISRLDASLNYAYHLQLNGFMNLSVGVSAGISRISLDVSALDFEDDYEPATIDMVASQIRPDLGVGVWLYGANFFAGASVQQLIAQNLSYLHYATGEDTPHFFVTAGYRLIPVEDISVTPSVMIKSVSPAPLSFDANLKVSFRDRLWVGGSYRRNDSFAALAGINVSKLFNLTYSFDLTTSDLQTVTNGTHEIVLGVQLNNLYEVFGRQRMW
jgi:type IX secretion system PorP/SprF family membrane protein